MCQIRGVGGGGGGMAPCSGCDLAENLVFGLPMCLCFFVQLSSDSHSHFSVFKSDCDFAAISTVKI